MKGPILGACGLIFLFVVAALAGESGDETPTRSAPELDTSAAPTPVATSTSLSGSSGAPISGSVSSSTQTATPVAALTLRAEKSIRDNRDASADNVNLDVLSVQFEQDNGHLRVSVRPKSPKKNTDLLSNGSALAIITGKAIWTTYPEVAFVTVSVIREASGSTGERVMVSGLFSRETAGMRDYDSLRKLTGKDNKVIFCDADFYSLDRGLWRSLIDKGCMLASDGGVNQSLGGQQYAITFDGGQLELKTLRQVDVLVFTRDFKRITSAIDQNWVAFQDATGLLANGSVSRPSYYNFLRSAEEAMDSLATAAERTDVPPGLDSARNALVALSVARADAFGSLAKYLNKGDLEEQRKAIKRIQDSNSATVAAVLLVFSNLTIAGLQADVAWDVIQCDADARSCGFRVLSPGETLFSQ